MNQRATDTHEQVLKFAPKEKAQNRVAELDDAGQAIVAQILTAADLVKGDCDRAMTLAHKLSMDLRAAEDRTHSCKSCAHDPTGGMGCEKRTRPSLTESESRG